MATVVTPVPANKCIGVKKNGDVNRKFYCLKELDDEGSPVHNCVTMRYFKVTCPKLNVQCNTLSGAYVAAVTCCNLNLF